MHGDETVGRQLVIYFAEFLLQNYDKDERIKKLVDSIEIYLMPSLNPDGFAVSPEGSCYRSKGRRNSEATVIPNCKFLQTDHKKTKAFVCE